jgi:5-methylcytosine-specific restriction endonuclease McrA
MPSRPQIHRPKGYRPTDQRSHLEQLRRLADATRESSTKRGYDWKWRKLRAKFIAAYPLCCVPGCGKPTTDVDHQVSIAERPDLRLEWCNLRPFCHPHHSQRTAREQGFSNGRSRNS